ncbi:hypothetical protein [Celeribacter indicus]|uniref:Uncharacterized protein n=1 Tax=Celeribacter indicus TaxID=1208324 RepID=A0A0B5E5E0_9RHOB|nr:hypothetical protein [Celeribacter indicus]AJE48186.1 hypothetical protein P73_3471 [Celeribacter indicus]SDW68891.1 hypothetical protein SAMN05443573_10613 [Celeribacter indicus]
MPEHDEHTPEDLTPENEGEIRAERARMFTFGFWKSLLAGREGLGDTFWAGNYLAALFFIPVYILLLAIPPFYVLIPVVFALFGIYLLFVARAVWLAKPKGGAGIGWKIAGVIWTLMNAAMSLMMTPFSGGA